MSDSQSDNNTLIVIEHFEKIGDFNHSEQVRKAIQAMPNYQTKKLMIDKVLQRREEIKLAQENFKILKYGHIFRRFLSKFRASKQQKIEQDDDGSPKQKSHANKFQDDEVAHTTNVENSIVFQSNQSSIIEPDKKTLPEFLKQQFLENALLSFQTKKSQNSDFSKTTKLHSLDMMAQKDKEDRKKNVQENSEYLIMQAKLQQEAGFVKKEKLSNLVKKAVSKIDTGIKVTRLATLRGQRQEDEKLERDFTVKRRQAKILSENARFIVSDRRRLSQDDFSKRQSAAQTDRSLPSVEDYHLQTTKLPHLGKYFTIVDPFQVREQVEEEIFDFLMEQKQLNPMQKELFLRSDPKVQTKTIRNMESKVKNNIKLHFLHERDIFNKSTYSVAEIVGKKLEQPKPLSELKLKTLQRAQQQAQTSRALRKTLEIQQQAAIMELDESFASYTEIKLNNLYCSSKEIQQDVKVYETGEEDVKKIRMHKERMRQQYESKLVRTAKEIIDLSTKKMSNKNPNILQ